MGPWWATLPECLLQLSSLQDLDLGGFPVTLCPLPTLTRLSLAECCFSRSPSQVCRVWTRCSRLAPHLPKEQHSTPSLGLQPTQARHPGMLPLFAHRRRTCRSGPTCQPCASCSLWRQTTPPLMRGHSSHPGWPWPPRCGCCTSEPAGSCGCAKPTPSCWARSPACSVWFCRQPARASLGAKHEEGRAGRF